VTHHLTARLFDRSLTGRPLSLSVELAPLKYSKNAIGGCKYAELSASGDELRLWELIDKLRCPVEIADARGDVVWWGYVDEVKISAGGRSYGVDLRHMANRVRVGYQDAEGESQYTGWAENTDSSAAYGDKEYQVTVREPATLAMAERWRDTELARRKYPVPQVETGLRNEPARATVICRGWWETLDWQFYTQIAGTVEFTTERETFVHVDGVSGGDSNVRAAQSFTADALDLYLGSARVLVAKEGDPADNLVVAIYTDSAGSPGTLMDSVTVPAADISDSKKWLTVTFDDLDVLTASATYWVHLTRSGAGDASNYFKWYTNDEDVYAGALKVYDASWAALTGRDALFSVYGLRSVTSQLEDVLVAAQFISGRDHQNTAAVYLSPTQDGSRTIQDLAEEFLQVGTSNNRRLLAEVTRGRRVRIYEEPQQSADDAYLMADGTLVSAWGVPLEAHTVPYGEWVQLKDAVPDTANTTRIADPARLFLEEVEYNARTGALRIRGRNQPDPWQVGG
jgi:hypothetical protein